MTDRLQILAAVTSVVLLAAVIDMVRRRKLTEEYSLVWITAAVLLLAVSLSRNVLHMAARWLGVAYPPALLLLGLIVAGFVALLYVSSVLSRQRQQIERLVEEIALLSAQVRDLEAQRAAGGAAPDDNRQRDPHAGPYARPKAASQAGPYRPRR